MDTAEVQLTVGSVDGPDDAFAPITAVAVSPRGHRVFVLENSTRRVRILDRAGRPIATIGGPGGGPGEFGNPMSLGVMNDTLWVGDVFSHRYTFFGMDGDLLGDFRPAVLAPQRRGDYPARPSALLEDGTLMGSVHPSSLDIAEGRLSRVPILRLARSGEVLDTLDWRSVENQVLAVRSPTGDPRTGGAFTTQPFSSTSPVLASGLDSTILKVAPGPGGRAELVSTSFEGEERFRVPIGWEPIPLSEERVEAEVDRFHDMLRGAPSFADVSPSELRSWIVSGLYVPESLKPVARIKRSSNGYIWLLRTKEQENDAARWRVFSAQGERIRDVHVPPGIHLHAISGDDLWGVMTDPLDVPYLVRLSVRQAGP